MSNINNDFSKYIDIRQNRVTIHKSNPSDSIKGKKTSNGSKTGFSAGSKSDGRASAFKSLLTPNPGTNISTGSGDDTVINNHYCPQGSGNPYTPVDQKQPSIGDVIKDMLSQTADPKSHMASDVRRLGEHLNTLLGDEKLGTFLADAANRLEADTAWSRLFEQFLANPENGKSLGHLLGKMITGKNTEASIAQFLDQAIGTDGQGQNVIDQLGRGDQKETLVQLLSSVIDHQDLPRPLLDIVSSTNPQKALGDIWGQLTGNQIQGAQIGQILSAKDPVAALRQLSTDALNELLGTAKLGDSTIGHTVKQIITADNPQEALRQLSGEWIEDRSGENAFGAALGNILSAKDPRGALAAISAEQIGELTGNQKIGNALKDILTAEDPGEVLRDISDTVLERALGDGELAANLKSVIHAENPEAFLRELGAEAVEELMGDTPVGDGITRLIAGEDSRAIMADISGKLADKYIKIPQVGPIGTVITDAINGKDLAPTLGHLAGDVLGGKIGIPGLGAVGAGIAQILQGEDPTQALMSTASGVLMGCGPWGMAAGAALMFLQDPEGIGQLVDSAWTSIKEFAGNAWQGVTETVGGAVEGVAGFVEDVVDDAGDMIADVVDDVSDVIGEVVDDAGEFLSDVADDVGEFLDDVLPW